MSDPLFANKRICPKCGKLYLRKKNYLAINNPRNATHRTIYYHQLEPKELACVYERIGARESSDNKQLES